MPSLTVEELIDTACARAGSDDFGPDTWREGLEILVGALNREGNLNELGVAVFTDQIVGNLVNRLEVEQWYAQHPEIDEQEIVAPLFGLGMPRTGSTATSFLLACDRSRRSLRTWEAGTPCPPPETATEHTDPRIAASQAGIDMTNEMFPGLRRHAPDVGDRTAGVPAHHGARLPVAGLRGDGAAPELHRVVAARATWSRRTATTSAC